jgi:hypothetical protein
MYHLNANMMPADMGGTHDMQNMHGTRDMP